VVFKFGRALNGSILYRLYVQSYTEIEDGGNNEMVCVERIRGVPDYEKGSGACRR
jgi:hypothetical protein